MFSEGSRYANAGTYTVTLPDGTPVRVARSPLPVIGPIVGWHRRLDGERLDVLAAHYVRDATAAWKLGWTNGAFVLDALASHDLVAVPAPQ